MGQAIPGLVTCPFLRSEPCGSEIHNVTDSCYKRGVLLSEYLALGLEAVEQLDAVNLSVLHRYAPLVLLIKSSNVI